MTGEAVRFSDWARFIEVFCDAGSHDEIVLGHLVAQSTHWRFLRGDDDGVEEQRLIHAADKGVSIEALAATGRVATRYKVRCPACGDDITLGDLLGTGYATVLAQRDDPDSMEWVHLEPHRNLSKAADAGVSRLSITGLRRILALP